VNDAESRQLGKSEIRVTPVALGCWPIAGMTSLDVNDKDSLATIHAALDSGINFLDTAYCYGANGESERLVGQAIKDRRRDVVIASKGGIHWDDQRQKIVDARPQRVVRECDESLLRLGIDTIDLHYLHAPDPATPISATAGAFASLIEAGKIRTAGASNLNMQQLAEFHEVCPLTAVQLPYNMLQRQIEQEVIPWCLERQISVINYWPLMKGLLAGKIRRSHQFDPRDKRLSYDVFHGEPFEKAQVLLDELDKLAADRNKTVAQIVVNWTMNQTGITATLCGAKRAWQIEETAAAMGWQLVEDDVARIGHCLNQLSD
jgi:aryl-alcohol dehydrogenase-like predicted oxidoreductase